MSDFKRTICLDFDGVLHSYTSGWQGPVPTDPPMEGAQDFCRILKQDYEVRIFSTRATTDQGFNGMCDWLAKHDFPFMSIQSTKPKAVLYVDDRGFRFTGSFDDVLDFIRVDARLPSGSAGRT